MAGRLAGVSDVEWRLCEDVLPPAPPQRRRGMPHAPFRKILNTLLYILITGCRWCDVPHGPPWGSKSATHRWVQRGQADGPVAAMPARRLGSAAERGMMCGEYGAVDGAVSPWEGGRRGRRPRRERHRDAAPQAHGGRWHAPGQPHHAGPWGRSGPTCCRCVMPSRAARANGAAPATGGASSPRRQALRRKRGARSSGSGGAGPRSRSASGRPRKIGGGPAHRWCHGSQPSGPLPGFRRNTGAWSSAGSASPHVSRPSWLLPRFTFGSID